MFRYLRTALVCSLLALSGCLHNDIPYPVVELQITGVEGEGFTVSSIDLSRRIVTLNLNETTDIRNVKIDRIAATEGAALSCDESGTYDLRTPLYITLSLYQNYQWEIHAEQTIERRFRVEGQIGEAVFDEKNRIVTVYVTEKTDLQSLVVSELRLEPDGISTYSPTLGELTGSDFTTIRNVEVTCHGRTESWTLSVLISQQNVTLTQADAWTRVLWLYGEGVSGQTMGFRYRIKGTDAWREVSDSDLNVSGGSFSAQVAAEPLTTYEVKAFCGEEETPSQELTTEAEAQLPNGGLEEWSQPKAPWLPYASDASGAAVDPFWGSGNNGATVLGASYNLTTPVTDLHPGATGQYAAQLESRYVVMKLAAGNLFVGEFVGIRSLTHGIVNFGRPFTLRPTALRLWVKYKCGQITNAKDIGGVPVGESIEVGDYDNGSVFIALGTWTKEEYGYSRNKEELLGTDNSPISIDTRDSKTFFNPASKDVIGYGQETERFSKDIDEWTQITIPITYRATNQRPTHIIVVCSASRWGDYFTGSRDSKMWVDDIELVYDPLPESNR